jgi:hypothetical protein
MRQTQPSIETTVAAAPSFNAFGNIKGGFDSVITVIPGSSFGKNLGAPLMVAI